MVEYCQKVKLDLWISEREKERWSFFSSQNNASALYIVFVALILSQAKTLAPRAARTPKHNNCYVLSWNQPDAARE
jgi:hypothetical protein